MGIARLAPQPGHRSTISVPSSPWSMWPTSISWPQPSCSMTNWRRRLAAGGIPNPAVGSRLFPAGRSEFDDLLLKPAQHLLHSMPVGVALLIHEGLVRPFGG